MVTDALRMLNAIGQSTRYEVLRMLLAAGPEGMPSGDIARAVGSAHNTMSAHLAIMERAGLVSKAPQGRIVAYRARREAVAELVQHLQGDFLGDA